MRLLASIFILWLLTAGAAFCVDPPEFGSLETPAVRIQFEAGLQPAAEELIGIYNGVRHTVEQRFGWSVNFRPIVVLIDSPERFRQAAGSRLVAAYAVPSRYLIVMDYSRLSADPGRLEAVTKHELVHLLLHHHIDTVPLPRWLDEGVAQWVSEGIGELLTRPQPGLLEKAVLSGNHLSLARMERRFPSNREGLLLAYEQSRSVITFIADTYGNRKIYAILDEMKQGRDFDAALHSVLAFDRRQLEAQWLQKQQKPSPWLTFLARNIYSILFLFGAVLTVAGFVRFLIRKRNYRDDEDEEG